MGSLSEGESAHVFNSSQAWAEHRIPFWCLHSAPHSSPALVTAADGSLYRSCFRLNTKVLAPIGSLAWQWIITPEDDIAPEDKMSLAPSLALLGTSEMWSVTPVLSLQGTKDAPSLPEVYLLRPFYQMCIRPVDALGVPRLTLSLQLLQNMKNFCHCKLLSTYL